MISQKSQPGKNQYGRIHFVGVRVADRNVSHTLGMEEL